MPRARNVDRSSAPSRASATWSWQAPAGPSIALVAVPAGPFTMGYEDSSDESPVHEHAIARDYFIGRDAVTWAQYLAFCAATGHRRPATPRWGTPDDHPVIGVSLDDARAYCRWVGAALPSEAQWEKAARGEDGRRYPWGDDEPSDFGPNDLCVTWSHPIWGTQARHTTAPVDDVYADVSPYGARHMVGNINEWVADAYDAEVYQRYAQGDFTPPAEADDARRVVRGTSHQGPARFARAACRLNWDADDTTSSLGFRIALDGAAARDSARLGPGVDAPAHAGARLQLAGLAEASAALDDDRFADACALARRVLGEDARFGSAHAIVAKALAGLGARAEAAASWEAYAAACPHNLDARQQAAAGLHDLGRSGRAADLLVEVVGEQPDELQPAFNRLVCLWTAGRFVEAMHAADSIAAQGDIGPLPLLRGLSRFELGQTDTALGDIDAYLADSPEDAAAHNIRGDVLAELGRGAPARAAYETALGLIDAALADEPDDGDVRGRRAYALLALDRDTEALVEAERAAAAGPDEPLLARVWGRALHRAGRIDEALAAIERAHVLAPDRIDVDFDRARALAAAGRIPMARVVLSRVIACSPRLAGVAARDEVLRDVLLGTAVG